MVEIRLASEVPSLVIATEGNAPTKFVTPGKIITRETGFMRQVVVSLLLFMLLIMLLPLFRGHGTYMQDDCLYASVAGVVERVNQLISVRPLKSRYYGEIGDVVIGRVTEVQQKRWKLDTNSRLDSVLLLSSVNLPGGELVKKKTCVIMSVIGSNCNYSLYGILLIVSLNGEGH